jgi:hypothetical protein
MEIRRGPTSPAMTECPVWRAHIGMVRNCCHGGGIHRIPHPASPPESLFARHRCSQHAAFTQLPHDGGSCESAHGKMRMKSAIRLKMIAQTTRVRRPGRSSRSFQNSCFIIVAIHFSLFTSPPTPNDETSPPCARSRLAAESPRSPSGRMNRLAQYLARKVPPPGWP